MNYFPMVPDMTLAEFRSEGGKARAAALTSARRSEIASKAAKAMWKKRKKNLPTKAA